MLIRAICLGGVESTMIVGRSDLKDSPKTLIVHRVQTSQLCGRKKNNVHGIHENGKHNRTIDCKLP